MYIVSVFLGFFIFSSISFVLLLTCVEALLTLQGLNKAYFTRIMNTTNYQSTFFRIILNIFGTIETKFKPGIKDNTLEMSSNSST